MNNIEYRAWLVKEKKFVDLDAIIFKNGEAEAIYYIKSVYQDGAITKTNYEHIKEGFELMLFTGLTDKNGVKIFEGDIIKYTKHHGYNMSDFIGIVDYNYDYACFSYRNKELLGLSYPFCSHDCLQEDFLDHIEVIGNLCENIELAKCK